MQVRYRRIWLSVAGGTLVLAVYAWHCGKYWAQINDDAFITYRYSRFLALGRGPYYNPGEHVEGYTNFVMMPFMAAVIAACGPGSVLLAGKLIGIGAGLAALVSCWALVRRWLRQAGELAAGADWVAWLAPLAVAVCAPFCLNSTTGLETTLFAAFIVGGLWLGQWAGDSGRWRGAGVAFALCAWTRPEGAAVFLASLVGRLLAGEWRRGRRGRVVLDGALVAAAVVAQLAFRYFAYDGELLPNTYYAKLGGAFGATPAQYLYEFVGMNFAYVLWLPAVLPLVAGGPGLRRATPPALAVVVFGAVALFVTGSDWMPGHRLLVPYVPVWAALAVTGVAAVCRRFLARAVGLAAAGSLALILLLFVWQTPRRATFERYCEARALGYRTGHIALAEWLNAHASAGDTVALMDIGLVGYLCPDLRILDITGLTDRHIAKSPGGFLQKELDPAYVFGQRPRYLVLVLTAAFRADGSIDENDLSAWTPVEGRLLEDPAFLAEYFHPRPEKTDAPQLTRLAERGGAAAVFPHWHPGRAYLLFLFERDGVTTSGAARATTDSGPAVDTRP